MAPNGVGALPKTPNNCYAGLEKIATFFIKIRKSIFINLNRIFGISIKTLDLYSSVKKLRTIWLTEQANNS